MTGQCVAILGRITPTGLFELMNWTVPDPAPRHNTQLKSSTVIAFGGDFRFGSDTAPNNLTLELLSNFITSSSGEQNEQTETISRFAISGLITTGS